MKKLFVYVLSGTVGFAVVAAQDALEAPFVTNSVPAGTTVTATGPIQLQDGTPLEESGEGKLVLPNSAIGQGAPLQVSVTEGTLEVKADALPALPLTTLSESVKAKMAVWLSAKDAEHLIPKEQGGTEIETWYDVRETDIAHPKYIYAAAEHCDLKPGPTFLQNATIEYQRGILPQAKTALYFGGFASGISMVFKLPDGSFYASYPMDEMTAVHGVAAHPGNLFGNSGSASGASADAYLERFLKTDYTALVGYGWMHCWGPLMGDAKIWVDGEVVDRAVGVHRGYHLLHRRSNTLISEIASSALSKRRQALYSFNTEANKKGGDYLCEVMYFTNRLTSVERMEVQDYLMRKWFDRTIPQTSVKLASGATLEVSSDTDVTDLDFTVEGGSFVKKGDGTLLFKPSRATETATPSALTLAGGSVVSPREVALAAAAGDRITAARIGAVDCKTVTVSRVAGAIAGQFVKTGDAPVTVASISGDVEKVRVESGVLTLGNRAKGTCPRKYEIEIPNHSFEDWSTFDADNRVTASVQIPVAPSSANCCWGRTDGNCRFYNYSRWMAATTTAQYGAMGAAITAYNLDAVAPPDGECAAYITGPAGKIYTTITAPEDGEYELDFMFFGRGGTYTTCAAIRVQAISADGTVTNDFGAVNYVYKDRFVQQALRASMRAGTYNLYLGGEWWNKDEKNDKMTFVVDDLHLYRIGDYRTEWKIPGGDFEVVTGFGFWSSVPQAMDSKYGVAGWTFDAAQWQGGSSGTSTEYYPSVGVVGPRMKVEQGRIQGNGYLGTRRPLGGEWQLLFRKPNADNTVHATFTPPAGTWYLTCAAAMWCNFDDPRLQATVTLPDGTTADLGAIAIGCHYNMKDFTWPIPFTADGGEVTLNIAYTDTGAAAYHGVVADDFKLVADYANDREIVRNGDLEMPRSKPDNSVTSRDGWTCGGLAKNDNGETIAQTVPREYGSTPSAFGTDFASGTVYAEIFGKSTFYQTLRALKPGIYRLTFLTKGRLNSSSVQELSVELIRNGITNRIGLVETACRSTYEQRTFAFGIEEYGDYTLFIRGTKEIWYYNCIDDISVRYLSGWDGEPFAMPKDVKIAVDAGARLQLDFSGTNTVRTFRANGKSYRGVVSRENCPEIDGPGSLYAEGEGWVIMFR